MGAISLRKRPITRTASPYNLLHVNYFIALLGSLTFHIRDRGKVLKIIMTKIFMNFLGFIVGSFEGKTMSNVLYGEVNN